MALLIQAGETTAARKRVYFQCADATDGMAPETGEAGGQPQISTDGGAFADAGIGVLVAVGNGRYYAELTDAAVESEAVIESRYKSAETAEAVGTTAQVVGFDPGAVAVGAYTGTPPTANAIATAVWNAGTRTLTSFGVLVASIWAYATRTLTRGPVDVTETTSTLLQGRVIRTLTRELNSYQPLAVALERGGEAVDVSEGEVDHISLTLYDPASGATLVDHVVMTYVTDGTDGQVAYQLTDEMLSSASAATYDVQLEVFWSADQSESAVIADRVTVAEHHGTHA